MTKTSALALSLGAALAAAIAGTAGAAEFTYTGSEAGWDFAQSSYTTPGITKEKAAAPVAVRESSRAIPNATQDGFRFVGGDAGWRLATHHYALRDGQFRHTADCDHTVRAAPPAPTALELEQVNSLYGGA